jgi:hypothetical protein
MEMAVTFQSKHKQPAGIVFGQEHQLISSDKHSFTCEGSAPVGLSYHDALDGLA